MYSDGYPALPKKTNKPNNMSMEWPFTCCTLFKGAGRGDCRAVNAMSIAISP